MIIQVLTENIISGNVELQNVSTSYPLWLIAKTTGEETMGYIKECNVYQRKLESRALNYKKKWAFQNLSPARSQQSS